MSGERTITNYSASENVMRLTCTISPAECYIGEAKVGTTATDLINLTSLPIWRIKRIKDVNDINTEEYADGGKFTQIWDNRLTIFNPLVAAPAIFTNVYSVLINGVDEYGDCGNIASFERTDPFSVSFWFKTEDTVGAFVSRRQGTPSYKGWEINNTSGAIGLNLSSNNVTTNRIVVRTTAATFNDNTWHHVVITYDGSSLASGINIYIDENDEATSTIIDNLSGTIITLAGANIASRNDGENIIDSYIDEVAIYDKELSQAEVTNIYNSGTPLDLSSLASATNLYAWWRFTNIDILNIPLVVDHSDNGRTCTLVLMDATNFKTVTP